MFLHQQYSLISGSSLINVFNLVWNSVADSSEKNLKDIKS